MSNKKGFTILGLVCFLALSCQKSHIGPTADCNFQNPADSSGIHPKAAVFQDILNRYTKKGLPGISALIQDEDGIWMGYAGKADIAEGRNFLPCHPSKAASITKMMVATLTFMLQEQGRLSINDLVSKYVDADIISKIANADKVTIKDCMRHTTGFYDVIDDSEFYLAVLNNPQRDWSSEELLKYVYGKDALFAPNEGISYSNTNTIFVGMCLDKVLGYHHGKALRDMIWNPLGMNNTYLESQEILPGNVAQGYYDLYNNGSIVNVSPIITGSGNGYGGVFSTTGDLYKFITALFFDSTLVNAQSLATMQEFQVEDEKNDIGVGLLRKFKDFSPHLGIGHSGRDLGYSADLFMFPTRHNRLLIFFVNYGTDGNTFLRPVFWDFEKEMVLELTGP